MKNNKRFKKGDKLVIVGDFDFYYKYDIIKGDVYEVENVYSENFGRKEEYFYFKNNDRIHINIKNYNNFVLLKEYRKQKLQKICSN